MHLKPIYKYDTSLSDLKIFGYLTRQFRIFNLKYPKTNKSDQVSDLSNRSDIYERPQLEVSNWVTLWVWVDPTWVSYVLVRSSRPTSWMWVGSNTLESGHIRDNLFSGKSRYGHNLLLGYELVCAHEVKFQVNLGKVDMDLVQIWVK